MIENELTITEVQQNLFVGAIKNGYEWHEGEKTIISIGKTKEEALQNASIEIIRILNFNRGKIKALLELIGVDNALEDSYFCNPIKIMLDGYEIKAICYCDEEKKWLLSGSEITIRNN